MGGGSGGRPSLACVVEDGEGTSGLCPTAMDEQIWGTRGGSGGTLSSHSPLHCWDGSRHGSLISRLRSFIAPRGEPGHKSQLWGRARQDV